MCKEMMEWWWMLADDDGANEITANGILVDGAVLEGGTRVRCQGLGAPQPGEMGG